MHVGTGILYGTRVGRKEQQKEQRERVDLTGMYDSRALLLLLYVK